MCLSLLKASVQDVIRRRHRGGDSLSTRTSTNHTSRRRMPWSRICRPRRNRTQAVR